jgi:hypothetical protein
MYLRCEFSTSVAQIEEEDYIRRFVVDMKCYEEEDSDDSYLVGKLAMAQILWNDAIVNGESLLDICDNDTQELHEAQYILTGGHNTFRPSLKIREATNHVMFLHGAVFHPAIHAFRQGILDAAFNLFGKASVALMWLATSGLPESELADLGFKKVARKDLIFRHSSVRTPFRDRHPQGQDAEVEGRAEYEKWVQKEWKRFRGWGED